MPRAVLISNPRSRRNRRDPALAGRLRARIGAGAALLEPESPAALREALAALRGDPPEILAINGGDGSNHVALTAWLQVYGEGVPLPCVALMCGGTMNTVASGMGVKAAPERVADGVAALLARPQGAGRAGWPVARRWLVRVDDPDRPGEPQYGFLFGNGLISNFLELYYEGSEPTPLKAAWLLARGVASVLVGGALGRRLMAPVEAEVAPWAGDPAGDPAGDLIPSRRWLSVAAGTVDDIGLGFRPFFESVRQPGRLHLLALGCTPVGFVLSLPDVWRARPIRAGGVESRVARGFALRAPGPMGYMVDGDFHRGGLELRVRVGPEVRVIDPHRALSGEGA